MTLLQLQDVTYRYKNTAEAVLYQINYNFEPGKFYSIIGESGAGKSTLLSLLAGLDSPVEGSILFQGEDIRKKGYSYHRMHHISLVFQNYNLIDYLSPLENIRLVNKKASKDTLLELGLDESQIKRNVLQLSGGQQQRVAIARSLVSEAPVNTTDTIQLFHDVIQVLVCCYKEGCVPINSCVFCVSIKFSSRMNVCDSCVFIEFL